MSAGAAPRAVLLDIEGTVGSIRFVKEVLFPYARERLAAFVRANRQRPDVALQLQAVAAATGERDLGRQIAELERWSDEDRKVTPLKALQGMIWQGGYTSGALVAHLYPDAIAALQRWQTRPLPVYIYSSGSVAAQKLYFAHTAAGDLTAAIAGHFDTTTGAKQEAGSYRRIAERIGAPPQAMAFLSDIAAELEAASAAGWRALQVRRDGPPDAVFEPSITSFEQLDF